MENKNVTITKSMSAETKKVIGLILIVILGISIAVGSWWVKRKINYSLDYESQVQKQIEENLKSYNFIISELKKEIDYLKQEQDKLKKFIDKNKNIHNNNPLTKMDTDIFSKFQLALNQNRNTDIKDYRKIFKQRLLMKEYDTLRLSIEERQGK